MAKSVVAAYNSPRPFGFISFKLVTELGNVNRKKGLRVVIPPAFMPRGI